MPTYEYQCQKCGHRFSEFQRIVDPPIKDCPKCKKKNSVEQIISGGSGLIFKGSGFYVTDYKKKSSSGSSSSDSTSSSASSSDSKKDGVKSLAATEAASRNSSSTSASSSADVPQATNRKPDRSCKPQTASRKQS